MKVAIVILNWNGMQLLEQFLPSVVEHTPADVAEIIVADNGSTDNSVSFLSEKYPDIRLILLDKNYGFAEGYNRAIEMTCSEYVVLLNSDVEVTDGWIDAPLACLDRDAQIAAVQPKILAQRNKKVFEYAGAAGGFMDMYGYPFCRGRLFSTVESDDGQYDNEMDILWASGACLFIRTEVYRKEGGLDTLFFAHQEEIDMCRRLRARGYRIVCTPLSVVYHVGGATLNVESPHKTFLNFRNNLLMLYKNVPEDDLRHVFRVRYWLDLLAACQFLISGHPRNAAAVFRARRAFRKLRAAYCEIRKLNMEKTVCDPIPEVLRKSLIASYYIGGKKKFSEISPDFF